MKDWMIHALVAGVMVLFYKWLGVAAVPVAVSLHWYSWELAQRIAKDDQHRGAVYWWRIDRWGNTARIEAIAPISVAWFLSLILLAF